MRFVIADGKALELNYMWLPTWLGQDPTFKKKLEDRLAPVFVGRALTEAVLNEAHEAVIDYIMEKYPSIPGLEDYLDGIKFVEL